MTVTLIVDDDIGTRETFGAALRYAGHDVSSVGCARTAGLIAKQLQPDIAIVDLQLPDDDGIAVLRSIRHCSPHTIVVIVTAFGTTRSAVQAIQLGATEYLEKPIDIDDLVAFVSRVTPSGSRRGTEDFADPERHAIARWVAIVTKAVELPFDPHTVDRWAHGTATSPGALRARCRAAHLPAKASLDFARMLRVVMRFDGHIPIDDLLNIVDSRTLIRLLRLGAATGPPCRFPIGLDAFMERQRWITNPSVLRMLRDALRNPAERSSRVLAHEGEVVPKPSAHRSIEPLNRR